MSTLGRLEPLGRPGDLSTERFRLLEGMADRVCLSKWDGLDGLGAKVCTKGKRAPFIIRGRVLHALIGVNRGIHNRAYLYCKSHSELGRSLSRANI